jgi:uncharacterized SAM-binding protein YcdF (DUF218 family)
MYNFLKGLLLPPADFLGIIVVGLILLLCRRQRAGLALIVVGAGIGLLLSTPFVAGRMAQLIETPWTADGATQQPSKAQAIVVLAAGFSSYAPEYGGSTIDGIALQRLRYAAHLWRRHNLPILISGGQVPAAARPLAALMRDALIDDFGVPVRWTEERSHDTYENATYSAAILRTAGITTILLVTDATHMARAAALFERAGIDVIPAPTAFTAPARTFPTDYLPHLSGLQASYYAVYEILANAWYALHYR